MRRTMIILMILASILVPIAASSLPQVAVLDAVIPEDMDPAVVVPITDKISEELVNSGKYTVLDRASVEQVLREKEFQLSSGLVKNDEIRKAGEYLGAAFVVVARASKVGGTYFLSARMIDVKSGAITAQTSVEKPGNLDVLLALARTAGNRLAGGVVEKVAADKLEGGAPAGPEPPAKPVSLAREKKTRKVPALVVGVKGGASSAGLGGGGIEPDYGFGNYPDMYSGAYLDFQEYWAGIRYLAGAYGYVKIGRRLGLEADLMLVQKGFGATVDYWDMGWGFMDTAEEDWTFNYLEVPILVKFYLHERTQLYVGGGAFFSSLLGADSSRTFNFFVDDTVAVADRLDINSFDYGAVVSVGVDFPIRRYVLNLEARYSLGFNSFLNPDYYPDQPTHSVLSILAGFGYGLK